MDLGDDSGRNTQIGYIDFQGRMVREPRFRMASDFSEGLAGVCLQNWECGSIDKQGEFIIPHIYKYTGDFKEGLAEVKNMYKEIQYIDKQGKVVASIESDSGVFVVKNGKGKVVWSQNNSMASNEKSRQNSEPSKRVATCKIINQTNDVANGGDPIISYWVEKNGIFDGYIYYNIKHKSYFFLGEFGTPSLDEALSRYCK